MNFNGPRRNKPRKRRNLRRLTLMVPLVLLKGLNFKRRGVRNLEGLRRFESWGSLKKLEDL